MTGESEIANLEAYLAGAFYHRLNRTLRKGRRRQQAVELVPFSQNLERFSRSFGRGWEQDLDRTVQVKEAVGKYGRLDMRSLDRASMWRLAPSEVLTTGFYLPSGEVVLLHPETKVPTGENSDISA